MPFSIATIVGETGTGIGELSIIGVDVSVGGNPDGVVCSRSGDADDGIAVCVSIITLAKLGTVVSIISAGCCVAGDARVLQEVNTTTTRKTKGIALIMVFTLPS
jgi:hypothetical protein